MRSGATVFCGRNLCSSHCTITVVARQHDKSVLLTPSPRLWTRDRRLAQLAEHFGVHFVSPDLH
ncbi:hypothetical protein EMIT0158MI4_270041 [Burkholderia ambifaria]